MRTFKSIAAIVLASLCVYAVAQTVLLNAVTSTGPGAAMRPDFSGDKTFFAQAQTTAGTGTAVISVFCSMDGTHFDSSPLGTITLSLTTTATVANSFPSKDRCKFLQGNASTLTGTGTAATLYMGQ